MLHHNIIIGRICIGKKEAAWADRKITLIDITYRKNPTHCYIEVENLRPIYIIES